MNVKVEGSPLKFGNNQVTDAILSGKWGVKLQFVNTKADTRLEVILSREQATKLIKGIKKSFKSIDELKNKLNNPEVI